MSSKQFTVHVIVSDEDDIDISLDGLRIAGGKRNMISVPALGTLLVEAMLDQLCRGDPYREGVNLG